MKEALKKAKAELEKAVIDFDDPKIDNAEIKKRVEVAAKEIEENTKK